MSVYHFPCQRQDPEDQVKTSLAHLKSHGISFDTYWLDIERSDWPSNKTRNEQFIRRMVAAVQVSFRTAALCSLPLSLML